MIMISMNVPLYLIIIYLLIRPLKTKNRKNIARPIKIWKKSIPNNPLSQTDKNRSLKLLNTPIIKFYIAKTPLHQD